MLSLGGMLHDCVRFARSTLFAVINIAILIVLAFLVVHRRIAHQVALGAGGHDTLERAIRAHGNLAEYAPAALILLALAELNGLPAWQLYALGGVFTAARLSHAHGLLTATLRTRTLGTIFTIVVMMSLIGRLLTLAVLG